MPYKGVTGEVTLIPQGEEWDVEWKMDFASLSEEDGAVYKSPNFSFEGESWNFVIWPNGSKSMNSKGYIHLRLWKRPSNGPPINVEFCFSLKSVNGRKDFRKQSTGLFDHRVEYHDIARFISRDDLKEKQSGFWLSGFIILVCTLKRLKATGSASTQTDEQCSWCKETLGIRESISLHEECIHRPLKCPDCSELFLLKNWLHGHECQKKETEAATKSTESVACHHHNKIGQDLKQLFLKQENSDVVLRVKGREFQAHKAILAARSPVFASTFRNNMKEKETGIVDIEDCDPSVFPEFLCFLYSDEVDNLSEENVFGLFTAADKYDVPDLRRECLKFMKENLTVDIFCETLTLALQHSETELIHLATDFFIKNAKKILVTVKWQSFAAENPTQSNELFIKYVESVGGPNS